MFSSQESVVSSKWHLELFHFVFWITLSFNFNVSVLRNIHCVPKYANILKWQTDRHTNEQSDRQTGRQTDWWRSDPHSQHKKKHSMSTKECFISSPISWLYLTDTELYHSIYVVSVYMAVKGRDTTLETSQDKMVVADRNIISLSNTHRTVKHILQKTFTILTTALYLLSCLSIFEHHVQCKTKWLQLWPLHALHISEG